MVHPDPGAAGLPHVTLHVAEGVATITFRNPSARNALTRAMRDEFVDLLADAGGRPEVRVIVVTGASGNFSAGMDIGELQTGSAAAVAEDLVRLEEAVAGCPVPVIAAIDGYCVGGGTQLAVACDLRVASPRSRFAMTPAKLGVVYPSASITRFVRVVGAAVAKRLLFTADMIDAPTALRLGLVGDVTGADDFDSSVRELAHTVASRSSVSLGAAKRMIDAAGAGDVSEELVHEWTLAENRDLSVGLQAFAAGSAPHFPPRSP